MSILPDVLLATLREDLSSCTSTDPRIHFACMALERSLLKKWIPTEKTSSLADNAIALFRRCNEMCSVYDPSADAHALAIISQMRYLAERELGSISWSEINSRSRCGPGASVGSRMQNSAFEKLFINDFTTTDSSLYKVYRESNTDRSFVAAEIRRWTNVGRRFVVVEGSTLTTVAKNSATDRTICTEPSLNMYFQLGLGAALNSRLRRSYGYDESKQPDRNRELAYRGSVRGDLATIDLSSASDTISLRLCEMILPSTWYAAICDLRSQRTKIDGQWIELSMVSSMGNGFTFPLQTYIFSLLLRSLSYLRGVPFHRFDAKDTSFGVFGDDIIVPSEWFPDVTRALRALGFTPNLDKSFGEGPFRESCGSDFYLGHNVRGVYIKRLDTVMDRYSAVNRLIRWSTRHNVLLRKTISLLLPSGWRRFVVPPHESDDAGIKVPVDAEFFSMKVRRHTRGFTYLASYKPDKQVSIFRSKGNGELKQRFCNPLGFIISVSSRLVSADSITRRMPEGSKLVKVRKVVTPNWWYDPNGLDSSTASGSWGDICIASLTS
jgi:hypothetical protein